MSSPRPSPHSSHICFLPAITQPSYYLTHNFTFLPSKCATPPHTHTHIYTQARTRTFSQKYRTWTYSLEILYDQESCVFLWFVTMISEKKYWIQIDQHDDNFCRVYMAASKHRRGVRYEAVWGSTSDIVGNYLLRSSLETIRNHWKWYPEIISENWANTERKGFVEKQTAWLSLTTDCQYYIMNRLDWDSKWLKKSSRWSVKWNDWNQLSHISLISITKVMMMTRKEGKWVVC